jgi:YD repeat-containing protein
MRQIGRSVKGRVAGLLSALKFTKPQYRSTRITSLRTLPSRNALNLFLAGAITLSAVGIGVPALIDVYNKQQARIPHPLAATQPSSAPAADAVPATGKAAALPATLQAQLDADRQAAKKGVPRDTRHVKTLDENRTPTDTVYENADGSRTLERSMQATNFQDKNGKWQRVDTSLEQDTTTGKWRTKQNSWAAQFDQTDTGVALDKGGQTLSFKPLGSAKVKPTVTGAAPNQIVTYRNVWRGIDLMYQVSGSELKESIVVKSRAAQNVFDFDIAGASLTPDPAKPGFYKLDGALNDVSLAAPTIATADGGILGGAPTVSQSLVGTKLTVTLDPAWMAKQATKSFPLVIDPSYQVGTANNYVNYKSDGYTCWAGQGCGNSVGNASNYMWRFMFNVNLAPMQGKYVVSAGLHMEMPNPDGVHYYGVYDPRIVYMNHAGCFGFNCIDGNYGTTHGVIGSGGDFDVTPQYRTAVNVNDMGSWMMVSGEENWDYQSYKLFAYDRTIVSFNYDTLPNPSIISTPGAPADGGVSVSTQPMLKSTPAYDPDGPGPMKYRYIVSTGKNGAGNGNTTYPGVAVTGRIANGRITTRPNGPCPTTSPKTYTYYWQILTWDNWGGSAASLSPVYSFKVDLRNGKDATQGYDAVGPVSVDLATGNLTTSAKTHSIAALGGNLGISMDYNSPQRSRPGLVAQYWNNLSFSGNPSLTRVEPTIDYTWTLSSPYNGVITADNFSSRWTGYFVAPYTGTYTFGCRADDTMNIKLNNQTVASGGCYGNPVMGGTSVNLIAGQISPFLIEHVEATGPAYAQAFVRVTSGGSTLFSDAPIPTDWLQTGVRPVAAPHGLIGRYYKDPGTHVFPSAQDDPSLFLSRTDVSMSQLWGTGSPVPNGPADNFLVRWTGYFTAPATDTYTFGSNSDDGTRIIANGTTVLNDWTDHGATVKYGTSLNLNAGQTIPITVEYYEGGGGAQMLLLLKRASVPAPDTVVDSTWLSPKAQVLPDGWNLGLDADGDLSYDFAVIGQNGVTFRDSTGETHEYKWNGTAYAPPVNESGQLVRNSDGTITLQDSDGRTYVFNSDGTLKLSTSPTDDRTPAAIQYTYATTAGSAVPHLTQLTDGVTSSRWAKVWYASESGCVAAPAGFSAAPSGMICALETSDGQKTQFAYSGTGQLARLIHPGAEISDYGYDTLGRIVSTRDGLANDAITNGQRLSTDTTIQTDVAYDAIGRATSVTMPAATVGATRAAHTYDYLTALATTTHSSLLQPPEQWRPYGECHRSAQWLRVRANLRLPLQHPASRDPRHLFLHQRWLGRFHLSGLKLRRSSRAWPPRLHLRRSTCWRPQRRLLPLHRRFRPHRPAH